MQLILRITLAASVAAMGLAGCTTFSSSSPAQPAAGTTVIVPQGTTVVKCRDGTQPPCS